MAALVEGQEYGLSSHDNNSINKTIVFVKLTDSALKSIEDYARNKSNSILKPSIQFQSNNGVIRLPNTETHSKSYSFTLSNVETDGPQGSFECMQQTGSKSLDSLGCMMLKMHINANEDSYEKTRNKMAAVEKENKKFCTKEIKPSGSYVGRKVKVKRPLPSVLPKPASPPSIVHAPPKVVPRVYVNSPNSVIDSKPVTNTEKHVPLSKNNKNQEIIRQSCRDRIIHLLALRPYKKPELLAKLLSEGIKEKERRGISAILSHVALLKGNSYVLANCAWHEVQESWKFFTQEEAETIRRKKYEVMHNVKENGVQTPTNSPERSPSQKRTLEEWTGNHYDQRGKKQRISHFNRVDNNQTNSESLRPMKEDANSVISDKNNCDDKKINLQVNEHRTNFKSITPTNNLNKKPCSNSNNAVDSSRYKNCTVKDGQKSSPHLLVPGSNRSNHVYGDSKPDSIPVLNGISPVAVEVKKETTNIYNNHCDEKRDQPGTHSHNAFVNNVEKVPLMQKTLRPADSSLYHAPSPDSNSYSGHLSNKMVVTNGHRHHNGDTNAMDNHSDSGLQNVTSSMNGNMSPSSHDDSNDSVEAVGCVNGEKDDYLKDFVTIASRSQRASYKAAFNAEYEEYKTMDDKVRSIVSKFDTLEGKLNGCTSGTHEYFTIKSEIFQEYMSYSNDPDYRDTKAKLDFLYRKLSHIKKLVVDYDRACVANKC